MFENGRMSRMLIEQAMVMCLTFVLGITALSLIMAGAGARGKTKGGDSVQSDVRIAVSYINVALRQNDTGKNISVKRIESMRADGILIKSFTVDGERDTWIYASRGQLFECVVAPGEEPSADFSVAIANVEGFSVEYDEQSHTIINKFRYTYNKRPQELVSRYAIRNTNF